MDIKDFAPNVQGLREFIQARIYTPVEISE